MYQPPITTYRINQQPFHRQPVSDYRQINGIAWNQNNTVQQTYGVQSALYSGIPKQKVVPDYVESVKQQRKSKNRVQQDTTDNQESTVTEDLSDAYGVQRSYKHASKTKTRAPREHISRSLSRQTSLGAMPQSQGVHPQNSKPLTNSRSTGAMHDYIDKERRAHTMAPLTRILGPSSTPTVKLFAKVAAPNDALKMRASQPAQTVIDTSSHSRSQANYVSESNVSGEEEDEDDETPIIVKVRYDPDTGGPPSEDTIRRAVDRQLKQQTSPNSTKDSIVLDFLNPAREPPRPQLSTRPTQPVFNQSVLPASRPTIQPHRQNVTDSSQRNSQPSQLFLDPQQEQLLLLQKQQRQQREQQTLMLQQQRRLQQGLFLQQQKQREQQQLQQEALLQQHQEQQQKQQQIRQEAILLQQKQQQQLRQELLLEQEKQKQQLQEFLKHQEQRKLEKLQQIEEQKQRQLQFEQKRKQEQQRQFQMQRQQQLRLEQQKYQTTSLPPTGQRTSRPVTSIPPAPIIRQNATFQRNKNTHPLPPLPPSSFPKKSQQHSSNNTQRFPERNMYSTSTSMLPPTEFNTFNNYHQAYKPNLFVATNNGLPNENYSKTINGNEPSYGTEQPLQRSRTAPSSTEMFRPPSALDIPELTPENLCNMLDTIPTLRGCHFTIDYLKPTNPDGYPVPLEEGNASNGYPEAVVTDELPNEVMKYVKSSNNQILRSASESSVHVQHNLQSVGEVQRVGYNLDRQPSSIRYTGPLQYRKPLF